MTSTRLIDGLIKGREVGKRERSTCWTAASVSLRTTVRGDRVT